MLEKRLYGAPARLFCACDVFEVFIADNNNQTKWVPAEIQVWEEDPGDQWNMPLSAMTFQIN